PGSPVRVLPIERVVDFDPQSEDGRENPDQTALIIDDDPNTGWTTSTYFNRADLGGLKDGVGVILDLGRVREIEQVRLTRAGAPPHRALLTAPSTFPTAPRDIRGLRAMTTLNGAGEDVSAASPAQTRTRYVVVWLRSLPSVADGQYRGEIRQAT